MKRCSCLAELQMLGFHERGCPLSNATDPPPALPALLPHNPITDTERLDWLDRHCAFVADPEYKIGPYKVGELRLMADEGILTDILTGTPPALSATCPKCYGPDLQSVPCECGTVPTPAPATCTKAYKVSCRDDDHGATITFAESAHAADRRANSDMCDCPWIERTVHRAEAFDKYSPGPVTTEQYLAEGWYWNCACCERQIWNDNVGRIVTDDGHAYCNETCVRRALVDWEKLGPNAHKSILDSAASMRRALGKMEDVA